jgi:cobalt-zinc-cadmium efflux system outer membrane protein
MSIRRRLALVGLLLLGGCLYHVRERTDDEVCALAAHPYDLLPAHPEQSVADGTKSTAPAPVRSSEPGPVVDVQTAAFMQAASQSRQVRDQSKFEPQVPPEVPGSEAKPIQLPRLPPSGATPQEKEAFARALRQLYPSLPPLQLEPAPQPGPNGRPYTLADLQQIAAANSPELRQAVADVNAARGNWIQAKAYPSPTVGYQAQPSNDGSAAALQGPFIDQTIKFGGKLKLASAAAEMDLLNAQLALRRARSDLATRVRNAYYALLVAKETMRVNKALAQFTEDVYRLWTGMLEAGPLAPYEPMALRALADTARLAYRQSIQTYAYTWKQLVAVIGLRQLPLSEVSGRIDAMIPYFDYDKILAHVLQNHTDVLAAANGIDKARYNLKLAQITPFPDLDVNVALLKEYALPPKQFVHTATIGFPLPIWDQNKGAIMASEGALVRATEEPHRVAESLTNSLATAYMGYRTNLASLEEYRLHILPDQVRAYRGILGRRQLDQSVALGDILAAQQTLATDVTAYLGILGSLWTSVVSVADLLQTDDLFRFAQPHELPPLPDLEQLPSWPCCHECPPAGACQTCAAAEAAGPKPCLSCQGCAAAAKADGKVKLWAEPAQAEIRTTGGLDQPAYGIPQDLPASRALSTASPPKGVP